MKNRNKEKRKNSHKYNEKDSLNDYDIEKRREKKKRNKIERKKIRK